jgi:hypothetical protein
MSAEKNVVEFEAIGMGLVFNEVASTDHLATTVFSRKR